MDDLLKEVKRILEEFDPDFELIESMPPEQEDEEPPEPLIQ
jgi:hypothetical protein